MRNRYTGAPCPHFPERYRTEVAHVAHNQARWRYDERKRQERIPRQFESDSYPLRLKLQRLLAVIKWRCRTPEKVTYAGRGIQCHLTFDDLLFAWNRDGAEQMRRASIDRINNDGHYEPSNIRFIELAENIRRGVEVRQSTRLIATAPKGM